LGLCIGFGRKKVEKVYIEIEMDDFDIIW